MPEGSNIAQRVLLISAANLFLADGFPGFAQLALMELAGFPGCCSRSPLAAGPSRGWQVFRVALPGPSELGSFPELP